MSNVDKKFEEIGFTKTYESETVVTYEQPCHKYVHCITLLHKANGHHLIQSYEKKLNFDDFNNMIGMTASEAKLAVEKLEELGW